MIAYRQKDRVDVILANPQNYRIKESADLFLILMIHLLKDGDRAAIVLPEGYKAYSKTKPIRLSEFEPLKKWWNNRKVNEQA